MLTPSHTIVLWRTEDRRYPISIWHSEVAATGGGTHAGDQYTETTQSDRSDEMDITINSATEMHEKIITQIYVVKDKSDLRYPISVWHS